MILRKDNDEVLTKIGILIRNLPFFALLLLGCTGTSPSEEAPELSPAEPRTAAPAVMDSPAAAAGELSSTSSTPCGIDVHVHVGSPALQKGDTQYTAPRARLAVRAAGLSRVWLIANSYDEGVTEPEATRENDYVLSAAAADPESFVAVASVPIAAPWAGAELERAQKAGARAVKLHPVASSIDLTTDAGRAALDSVMGAAQQLGMVVLLHANFEEEVSAKAVLDAARRHSVRPVVLAHALTRFHALLAEVREDHVYVDTSAALAWPYFMSQESTDYTSDAVAYGAELVRSWRAFGIERVLFGSDMPFMDPAAAAFLLRTLPLTAREVDGILARHSLALGELGARCATHP